MKVILLQNVKKTGKKNDIVEVSSGYAQNALFPKKLAVPATAKELAKLTSKKEQDKERQSREESAVKKLLESLHNTTITVKEKVNEKGGLYHALDKEAIAQAISNSKGVSFDSNFVQLTETIKKAGAHTIQLEAFDQKVVVTLQIDPA